MTPAEHIAWLREHIGTLRYESGLDEHVLALCDAYEALAAAARDLVSDQGIQIRGRHVAAWNRLRALLGEAS